MNVFRFRRFAFDQLWSPLFWDGKSNCIVALAPTQSEPGEIEGEKGIKFWKTAPRDKYVVTKLCAKGNSKTFAMPNKDKKVKKVKKAAARGKTSAGKKMKK